MATATEIITRLGKPAAVARETGFPLTTIASWCDANFIPEWRRATLIAVAGDAGIPLSDADFPTPDQRISRNEARAA